MREQHKRICSYCGETINYTIIEDTWNMGHYGCNSPEIKNIGYDCRCKPSEIGNELKKHWIRCCQNCIHNKRSECINPETIKDFIGEKENSPFDKTKLESIPIIKPNKKCDFYKSVFPDILC